MYRIPFILAVLFCSLQSPTLHATRTPSRSATNQVQQLTDKDFANRTSQGISIVKFYADWCGACKQYNSTFKRVAGRLPYVTFYQADIDECDKNAARLKVHSLPTTILFFNGQEVARILGSRSEKELMDFAGKITP